MNKKGLLVVLSGPSGCGKGTVLKELLTKKEGLFLSVSATTRRPRPGEIDGQSYYFLSRDRFLELVDNGGMLEYACYCDNYYGTPKDSVEAKRAQGIDVILEIEVQGAMQIKQKCPDAVMVFVMPPSMAELARRLVDRNTEDEETVSRRMAKAVEEMRHAKEYDYIVVNDTVENAVENLWGIVLAEKLTVRQLGGFVDEVLAQV